MTRSRCSSAAEHRVAERDAGAVVGRVPVPLEPERGRDEFERGTGHWRPDVDQHEVDQRLLLKQIELK